MKYVIDTLRKQELKEQLPVIRLEIDYELLTLYDAMQVEDKVQIIKSKEKLIYLRNKMMEIEGK